MFLERNKKWEQGKPGFEPKEIREKLEASWRSAHGTVAVAEKLQ